MPEEQIVQLIHPHHVPQISQAIGLSHLLLKQKGPQGILHLSQVSIPQKGQRAILQPGQAAIQQKVQ